MGEGGKAAVWNKSLDYPLTPTLSLEGEGAWE